MIGVHNDESCLLTKVLTFSEKRRRFDRKVFMHIYGTSCVGGSIRDGDMRMQNSCR